MPNQNKECKPKKKEWNQVTGRDGKIGTENYNQAIDEMDEYYLNLLKPLMDAYYNLERRESTKDGRGWIVPIMREFKKLADNGGLNG